MIFNSFEFIFLFLPIVWVLFFLLSKLNVPVAKVWLVVASLFFYGYWNPAYLPLILISMLVNFAIGAYLGKNENRKFRKGFVTIGILFNVFLLGYFKYYDFFIENVNFFFDSNLPLKNLLLPLAISFYTFQQIAYVIDSYRMETKQYSLLNYSLFVTFFPQLIAGPIVHHDRMMPQFMDRKTYSIQFENLAKGMTIFAIGLFKKVVIADTFATYANSGYRSVETLSFIDSWITSSSYTLQLYFDFSGYSDMAIGLALLFNLKLSINFNSPYKALDIQDFWRRWHITLSEFLTKYLYIPLGGNRKGKHRTYINIFIIFLVSGIWHGAGWTFVIWGILHGVASIICRWWKLAGFKMNKLLAWTTTMLFVHLAWVFFRAPSLADAISVLKAMFGLKGVHLIGLFTLFNEKLWIIAIYMLIAFGIAFFAKNSIEIMNEKKRNVHMALFITAILFYSSMNLQKVSEFLYFNF